MATTINTINIGGVDKEIEDTTARNSSASAVSRVASVETEVSALSTSLGSEIQTLKSRVDAIADLPSGSTTGDAELIDIRTGINNFVYTNAGNAVRSQAQGLNGALINLGVAVGKPAFPFYEGYHSGSVGSTISTRANTSTTQRAFTSAISKSDMPAGAVIKSTGLVHFRLWFVDANNKIVGYTDAFQTEYTIPTSYNGNAYVYIYIDVKFTDDSNMNVSYAAKNISISNTGNKFSYKEPIIINGPIYLYSANEKIIVFSASTTRMQIGSTLISYTADKKTSLSIGEHPANLWYICIDASGNFYLRYFNELTSDDYCIGYCYQNSCYASSPYIICNRPPMPKIYIKQDIPIYINMDRLGYKIMPTVFTSTTGSAMKFGETFRILNYYNSNIQYDLGKNTIINQIPNGTLLQNSYVVTNEKILMVGDSISNRGWLQRRIKQHAPNVTFLGSYTTGTGIGITDYKCEAVPGSTAREMIEAGSHINTNYATYIANFLSGQVPDIVTIEFGLNESSASEYFSYIQLFIDSIRAYDSAHSRTTKVYVLMPFERALSSMVGVNTYNAQRNRILAERQCQLWTSELTDCVIIPTHMIFDDKYDYNWVTSTAYGYGVSTQVLTDFVHPSEVVGFNKLADMIYSYFGV